jgi:sulfonate transport system substrate-binding protein
VLLRKGILLLSAVTLAACGTTAATSGDDLTKVVLKVGDQKGSQKALLTAAGLEKAPYKIEWSTFTSGPPLLEAASGGAIDIGAVGNTPPIFAAAANAKIAIVSSAKGNVTSDAILVPADSPLRTVQDLRGRTVGVAKGSSAHGQLLLTLKAANLATKDGRTALGDTGKSAAIKDYVTRIAKAQKWSDTHRTEWATAWSADTGLAVKVTAAATASGPDLPVALDDQLVSSEQQLADAFTADGILTSEVDFPAFVDKRYAADLEAARSNP